MDTITVLHNKTQHKIQLEGIDAPEKGQAYGTKARQALSDKIFGQTVRVEWKQRDRYGRIIGRVYLGERDVSLEMVTEGMAWHYKKYSKEAELADAEKEARKAARGLWADIEPTPPWEWRRERKSKKQNSLQNWSIEMSRARLLNPGEPGTHAHQRLTVFKPFARQENLRALGHCFD